MTIYKYTFPIQDEFLLKLPRGAKVLHADMQGGQACIWALVTPDQQEEVRRFRVIGTGHPINPINGGWLDKHVATFQNPPFVWHLFDLGCV